MTEGHDTGAQIETKLAEFQALCHQSGLKVTPQRLAVYRFLLETNDHPSADMVFREVRQQYPHISLDTVSRTLHTLTDMGIAYVIEGTGGAKRFDTDFDLHQHFKCVKCNRIVDFHYQPFDNVKIPDCLNKAFVVLRKTVYFEGICDRCSETH